MHVLKETGVNALKEVFSDAAGSSFAAAEQQIQDWLKPDEQTSTGSSSTLHISYYGPPAAENSSSEAQVDQGLFTVRAGTGAAGLEVRSNTSAQHGVLKTAASACGSVGTTKHPHVVAVSDTQSLARSVAV